MKTIVRDKGDHAMIYVGQMLRIKYVYAERRLQATYKSSPRQRGWWSPSRQPIAPDWDCDDADYLYLLGPWVKEWLIENGFLKDRRKPRAPRDSQKQKLYSAEQKHPLWNRVDFDGRRDAQEFVNRITASKLWRDRQPHVDEVTILTSKRLKRHAYATGMHGRAVIVMPPWSQDPSYYSKMLVIHELAHHLTSTYYGPHANWDDHESHGWQFADNYLALVSRFLGTEAAQELRRLFREGKVRYRPKRTRNVSQEAREAARERMLAMHAARKG